MAEGGRRVGLSRAIRGFEDGGPVPGQDRTDGVEGDADGFRPGADRRRRRPVLGEPLWVDQVALLTQTHRVAPFRVVDRFRFRR